MAAEDLSIPKKIRRLSVSRSVAESDDTGDNGLLFNNIPLPIEVIQRIFCFADEKSLLNCQLVCKRWNEIIMDYVWRKKAEIKTGCKFSIDSVLEWKDFYAISAKNIFERNLIKNHSGENGLRQYWKKIRNGGNGWIVECPPVGVPPLPQAPEFEKKQHCFVTSYGFCSKQYVIDLEREGFSINILDNLQPPIEISEWISSRWDCAATYGLKVYLMNSSGDEIDKFAHEDFLEGNRQNEWFNVKHEFKNYGRGLRKICFVHSGRDRRFWAGHYGSKMAGACVKFEIPDEVKAGN